MDTRGVLDHNGEQDTLHCMFRLDNAKAFRKLLGLQIEVAKVSLLNLYVYKNMSFFGVFLTLRQATVRHEQNCAIS
jgi:hypothetical protein